MRHMVDNSSLVPSRMRKKSLKISQTLHQEQLQPFGPCFCENLLASNHGHIGVLFQFFKREAGLFINIRFGELFET